MFGKKLKNDTTIQFKTKREEEFLSKCAELQTILNKELLYDVITLQDYYTKLKEFSNSANEIYLLKDKIEILDTLKHDLCDHTKNISFYIPDTLNISELDSDMKLDDIVKKYFKPGPLFESFKEKYIRVNEYRKFIESTKKGLSKYQTKHAGEKIK